MLGRESAEPMILAEQARSCRAASGSWRLGAVLLGPALGAREDLALDRVSSGIYERHVKRAVPRRVQNLLRTRARDAVLAVAVL